MHELYNHIFKEASADRAMPNWGLPNYKLGIPRYLFSSVYSESFTGFQPWLSSSFTHLPPAWILQFRSRSWGHLWIDVFFGTVPSLALCPFPSLADFLFCYRSNNVFCCWSCFCFWSSLRDALQSKDQHALLCTSVGYWVPHVLQAPAFLNLILGRLGYVVGLRDCWYDSQGHLGNWPWPSCYSSGFRKLSWPGCFTLWRLRVLTEALLRPNCSESHFSYISCYMTLRLMKCLVWWFPASIHQTH